MPNTTQDVSIYDEENNISLKVNSDGSINAIMKLSDGNVSGQYASVINVRDEITDTDNMLVVWSVRNRKGMDNEVWVGKQFDIYRHGSVNKYEFRITSFQEGCPEDENILYTLSAGEKVCQIFQASVSNIQGIKLLLSSLSVEDTIDDFEGTFDWVSSDSYNTQISQDTTIYYEGLASMKIYFYKWSSNDEVSKTLSTALVFDDRDSIRFWIRSDSTNNSLSLIFEDNAGNRIESPQFNVQNIDAWERIGYNISDFSLLGSTFDYSNIVKIIFKVKSYSSYSYFWIDLIKYLDVNTTNASLSIYDFGVNSSPTSLSDGTLLTTDDGSNTINFSVDNALPKGYIVNFERGIISGNELTIGNYYGVVLEGEYLNIHGSNVKLYQNGDFYTVDSLGAMTAKSQTAVFGIYSAIDEYIIRDITFFFENAPLKGRMYIAVLDTNKVLKINLVQDLIAYNELNYKVEFQNTQEILTKNDLLLVWFEHDESSSLDKFSLMFNVVFKEANKNG